jgi:hypothetical protein
VVLPIIFHPIFVAFEKLGILDGKEIRFFEKIGFLALA